MRRRERSGWRRLGRAEQITDARLTMVLAYDMSRLAKHCAICRLLSIMTLDRDGVCEDGFRREKRESIKN